MDKPIREYEFKKWDDDVLFLRNCLEETLTDLGMEDIANALPWSEFFNKKLAQKISNSDKDRKYSIPVPLSERSIQIYALCFQLLNLVEENTTNQVRRVNGYRSEGLWDDTFSITRKAGISPEGISNLTKGIKIEPVLTAHPTEAKRATVLEHYRDLYLLLVKSENKMWSPSERASIKDDIKSLLERLLRTGDLYLERPEVTDELRNITHYLKNIFPKALPIIYRRFQEAWQNHYPEEAKAGIFPEFPCPEFSTWVGGDRDGHPLVTSSVTHAALLALRNSSIDNLSHQLTRLAINLSLNDRIQKVPDFFNKRLLELETLHEEAGTLARLRNPGEPWRQFINLLILGLPKSDKQINSLFKYETPSYLMKDLLILKDSLISIKANLLFKRELEPVILNLKTFGFHLAKLDIRQNSGFHDRAIEQFLSAISRSDINYSSWSKEKRLLFLNEELNNKRPFLHREDRVGKEGDETRDTLRVLASHGKKYGYEGIGSLIVSMTRDLSDLLGVYLLAKEAGLAEWNESSLACPLPVVPLFETISDLDNSRDVVEDFLKHPVYISSKMLLEQMGSSPYHQQIMIGYSDSSKDGGVLASYWRLYQCQSRLITLGQDTGASFLFFHGRGGTISRGAGPTERFLAALPAGSLNSGLRVTEQGESISQKYANLLTASYNLELLQAGTVRNIALYSETSKNNSEHEEAMTYLSECSQRSYQKLLSEEGFIKFFREATPIDIIEHSRFGSRPPKRRGADSLDDLRAIPWVFSWNQARFFLGGWFGVGTALSSLKDESPKLFNELANATRTWAPARYIFTNIESSIYSGSAYFMKEYSSLVIKQEIRDHFTNIILDEFEITKTLLTELFQKSFSDRRPRLAKTLAFRDKTLELLHQSQIIQIRKWRENPDENILSELLLITNAIAGGLRTTG
ncbi:MAG TPA: phosphoenolpyruvate carboxylase [Oligoflexia bacterium]|nr:phosphoenolpyruvate carboxylase [Oligoflexia bacterium]HMP47225.1 phosphoenolpyruvate carboxylase [Oligoflexia bacterium]